MVDAETGSDIVPQTTQPSSMGPAVRRMRVQRGLSVADLAAAAGVTSGAISQIESDRIQPTITTLRRIAEAIGVPVFRFFLPTSPKREAVVRRRERKALVLPRSDARYELMTPDLSGDLEVLEMRLPPGGTSAEAPMGHPGEECMVVIKGRAELELDGEIHVLGPGDSATYFAQVPHRIRNVGRGEMIAISAITPPSF